MLTMFEHLPAILHLGGVISVREVLAMKLGDTPHKFEETMYYPSPEAIVDRCQEIVGKHERGVKGTKQSERMR